MIYAQKSNVKKSFTWHNHIIKWTLLFFRKKKILNVFTFIFRVHSILMQLNLFPNNPKSQNMTHLFKWKSNLLPNTSLLWWSNINKWKTNKQIPAISELFYLTVDTHRGSVRIAMYAVRVLSKILCQVQVFNFIFLY